MEKVANIRKLAVDFDDGFTILTGETGAGKSILIDSIGLLLGGKSRREMIGAFADHAFVKAGFSALGQTVTDMLRDENIEPEDGTLWLERRINRDGRTSARAGGVPVTVSFLQKLAPHLINIHGQHDNVLMLDPENHIRFLDEYAGLEALLAAYRAEYEALRRLRRELQKTQEEADGRTEELNRLAYKLKDYEQLEPYEGMKAYLEEKREVLQNRDTIYSLMHTLQPDEDHSIAAIIDSAIAYAEPLLHVDERIREMYGHLLSMRETASSVLVQGEDLLGTFEDGESLQNVEDQLYELERMLQNYGPTEADLLIDWENTQKAYDRLFNLEDEIGKVKAAYLAKREKVQKLAADLSEKRRKSAEALGRKVEAELAFLDMSQARFEIRIEDHISGKGGYVYNNRGYDKVEFLLSANAGQPLRPLHKIASGGELSRIMLSLTNVFSAGQDVPTLIFDEVDTGVSGKTAEKIGVKLTEVAARKQVLCITHLAQIAALGNAHYKIQKSEQNGQTETVLEPLEGEARVEEIARIIGGIQITDTVRQTAREMLRRV